MTSFRRTRPCPSPRGRLALAAAAWVALAGFARGGVQTDGSVGPARSLAGPNYLVPASLGQQRGGNLFHSFGRLDLAAGESATFSGPSSVTNVLARVTGGASTLDGTLRCTIPDANFYLVNPAGVVFGPNASLDVKGSFAVTTAAVVKLADGGQFHAARPADSVLTSAPPAAFGFLADRPAAVVVGNTAGDLAVPAGKVLSVVGGDIHITGGLLDAPGGQVNLVSVGSPGEVALDAAAVGAAAAATGFSRMGDVTLSDGGTVFTAAPRGGRVVVRGGNLTIDSAGITAVTGAQDGLGVDLSLTGALAVTNGTIATDTDGPGRAGDVVVSAAAVTLDGQGAGDIFNGLSARTTGPGRGGDVRVQTGTLTILNAAQLAADTTGAGRAGDLTLDATAVVLDGKGFDPFAAADPLAGTGLFARAGLGGAAGAGGLITVRADSLSVAGGAAVGGTTVGSGDAGSISVTAKSVTLDGQGLGQPTGLIADTLSGGRAGRVDVTTDSLSVIGGGSVSASTFGAGDAGAVAITAKTVVVGNENGQGLIAAASTTTGPGGNAGTIGVRADSLQVNPDGQISVDTTGRGAGGAIDITAGDATLRGLPDFPAVVSAGSRAVGPDGQPGGATRAGNAGTIRVQATTVNLTGNAFMTSATSGPGAGGAVTVVADAVAVDGFDTGSVPGILADSLGPTGGPAGRVTVQAGTLQLLSGGTISSTTYGPGAGGVVTVDATDVVIDRMGSSLFTGVSTDTNFPGAGGRAGAVTVRADTLQLLGGGIRSNTEGLGNGGDVTVHAAKTLFIDGRGFTADATGITTTSDAAGPGGNAGTVTVEAGTVEVRDGGQISSNTNGLGNGGSVIVTADATILLDAAAPGRLTGIAALSRSDGPGGRGGDVTVNAEFLHVSRGAVVSAETFGGGDSGNIAITANRVLLDDPAGTGTNGGVFAQSNSSGAGGHAGNITVAARTLAVLDGNTISSNTFGLGDGGRIGVTADNILLDRQMVPKATGIVSQSENSGPAGHGGNITIRAGTFLIFNGAAVDSTAFGSGPGGTIDVTARSLELGNTKPSDSTSFVSAAVAGAATGGTGGNVRVSADRVSLSDGAAIFTETLGPNAAGAVSITAGQLRLSGGAAVSTSTSGSGPGGALVVEAGALTLRGGAKIGSSSAGGDGEAGRVDLAAKTIRLRGRSAITTFAERASGGDITIHAARNLSLDHSLIDASAARTGGNVVLRVARTVSLFDSQINAEAGELGGNGGNVSIDPIAVVLNSHSSLVARAINGNGGNVMVRAQTFVQSPDSFIDVTSQFGMVGNFENLAPELDIAGSLAPLSEGLVGATTRLAPSCALTLGGGVSSFVATGRGGTPPDPGGWQPE